MFTIANNSGNYRFVRNMQSPNGFLSSNQASMDALRDMFAGHSFDPTVDDDEIFEAKLTFSVCDIDAGGHINQLCMPHFYCYKITRKNAMSMKYQNTALLLNTGLSKIVVGVGMDKK